MKKELICHTCRGKRFIQRSMGVSFRNQEHTEDYECIKCKEWIRISYPAKLLKRKKSDKDT